MLFKLITAPTIHGRLLRAPVDGEGRPVQSLICAAINVPHTLEHDFGIRVFEKLVEFAHLRDEVRIWGITDLLNFLFSDFQIGLKSAAFHGCSLRCIRRA